MRRVMMWKITFFLPFQPPARALMREQVWKKTQITFPDARIKRSVYPRRRTIGHYQHPRTLPVFAVLLNFLRYLWSSGHNYPLKDLFISSVVSQGPTFWPGILNSALLLSDNTRLSQQRPPSNHNLTDRNKRHGPRVGDIKASAPPVPNQ